MYPLLKRNVIKVKFLLFHNDSAILETIHLSRLEHFGLLVTTKEDYT